VGHAGVTIDGVGLSQNPTTELFRRAKKLLSRAKRCSETRPYVMAVTKKRFFLTFPLLGLCQECNKTSISGASQRIFVVLNAQARTARFERIGTPR
jgi:hypothetical protein